MQANKCGYRGLSASVQLYATTRTMHNVSLFQQKVIILNTKQEKFWKKNREKGQISEIPEL